VFLLIFYFRESIIVFEFFFEKPSRSEATGEGSIFSKKIEKQFSIK